MDNLELYNKVRSVPREAQTPFDTGRFKGTDINPMWRIKVLTEQFGACGNGWYFKPISKWSETVSNEVCVFVDGELFVKYGDEWSEPIYGIGGSKLLTQTKKGMAYVNDEAYKMATTDAISVACKNLGIGADIYWENDNDKYIDHKKDALDDALSTSDSRRSTKTGIDEQEIKRRDYWRAEIEKYADAHKMSMEEVANDYKLNGKTDSKRLMEVYNHMKDPSTSDSNEEQMDDFAAIDEQVPF